MDESIENALLTVKTTDVREEIVRELYPNELKRPSELEGPIRERTGKSKGAVYESLKALEGTVVNKLEREGIRGTVYSLTDLGREVAEHLGLTESPPRDSGKELIGSETTSASDQMDLFNEGTAPPDRGELEDAQSVPDEYSSDSDKVDRVQDQIEQLIQEQDLTTEEEELLRRKLGNRVAQTDKD